MNTKIEQDFYKIFKVVSNFKDEVKSSELDYYLDCAKRKNAFDIEVKDLGLVKYSKLLTYKYYPPITPEIVLRLLEIVLKQDKYAFYFNRSNGKFVFQENINTFTECRKKSYQDYRLEQAILKACNQLGREIQKEIKEIFQ